jgi:ubiquinone/menaquinone biosynthesis C-methylase UbiE
MSATAPLSERAAQWGRLWGSRALDWAASEEQQLPTYEEAIRRVGVSGGQRVLDVGCGSGVFLRAAADLGADVYGIDASEALLELARQRVPEADLRLGDIEALPYDDDCFDVVAGFNSFFFAVDLVAALREAQRVAKPGAPVVIQVWGRHERCDLEAMKVVVRPFLPPRPPDAPPEPELWAPGVLEEIATSAGLTPESTFDVSWAFEYADVDELARAMLAPAGIADLVGPSHEQEYDGRSSTSWLRSGRRRAATGSRTSSTS